jgi:hypothetical protein
MIWVVAPCSILAVYQNFRPKSALMMVAVHASATWHTAKILYSVTTQKTNDIHTTIKTSNLTKKTVTSK